MPAMLDVVDSIVGANKICVIDGFASDAECAALANWTEQNFSQKFFRSVCGRISTRADRGKIPFPQEAYVIQNRVIEALGLSGVRLAPFVDGMYAGCSRNMREYRYEPHRDPTYFPGTYTLHCNIVVTDSPGGAVAIQNNGVVEMQKGRLVAYPVSELTHEVLEAKSEAPRNLWVFGFCVPRVSPHKEQP